MDSWSSAVSSGNIVQAFLVTSCSVATSNEATITTDGNSTANHDNTSITVFLENELWDDDANDTDSYEETKNDFMNFGKIIIIA